MKARTWLLRTAALAVLVALVLGHVWFHYRPRTRPARPDASSSVAAVLGDDRFPFVLWLPYPHQNLGVLRPHDDDHQAFLAAAARLGGQPPPRLPSFGGFAVPPAREMVLAADRDGGFLAKASLYPAMAAFARLAGKVAGNPWLSGGEVTIDDRPATVAWQGNVWIVSSGIEDPGQAGGAVSPTWPRKVLALTTVTQAVPPFAAGHYGLRRVADGLELRGEAEMSEAVWAPVSAARAERLVVAVLDGDREPTPTRGLAVFAPEASASLDLPRSAAFNRIDSETDRGVDPWKPPGSELLRLVGRSLRRSDRAGFALAAVDRASLRAVEALAPSLRPVSDAPVGWALWSDLPNALAEVERIGSMLAALPLIPRRETQRWLDAATVLRPAARHFGRFTVAVDAGTGALRARLTRRTDHPTEGDVVSPSD